MVIAKVKTRTGSVGYLCACIPSNDRYKYMLVSRKRSALAFTTRAEAEYAVDAYKQEWNLSDCTVDYLETNNDPQPISQSSHENSAIIVKLKTECGSEGFLCFLEYDNSQSKYFLVDENNATRFANYVDARDAVFAANSQWGTSYSCECLSVDEQNLDKSRLPSMRTIPFSAHVKKETTDIVIKTKTVVPQYLVQIEEENGNVIYTLVNDRDHATHYDSIVDAEQAALAANSYWNTHIEFSIQDGTAPLQDSPSAHTSPCQQATALAVLKIYHDNIEKTRDALIKIRKTLANHNFEEININYGIDLRSLDSDYELLAARFMVVADFQPLFAAMLIPQLTEKN